MKNYRIQNGCYNCNWSFRRYDFDECDEFFCVKNAPKRPYCLSIALEDCPETITKNDCEAWDNWSEERKVDSCGICDFWEDFN